MFKVSFYLFLKDELCCFIEWYCKWLNYSLAGVQLQIRVQSFTQRIEQSGHCFLSDLLHFSITNSSSEVTWAHAPRFYCMCCWKIKWLLVQYECSLIKKMRGIFAKRSPRQCERGGGGHHLEMFEKQQGAAHSPKPHHSLPDTAHFQSMSVLRAGTLLSHNDWSL